jgi:ribosomal protein L14E/L6E/L27E
MSQPTFTALLSAIALCIAASVGAQTMSNTVFPPYLPDAATDSLLVVVELRDLAAIEFDRDVADRKRIAAGQREAAAQIFQSRAAMKIEIKDTEITALKARVKQAKSERDDTMTEQFESERKHAEFEKQLLRRREQLRQSDIRFAKAEFEYHDAAFKAYEHELQLALLRANRAGIEMGIPSQERFEKAWQLDKQIRELEGRTLDALREASHKQKNLAEQAVKIFQARKKVWEAQRDLINSAAGSK